MFDRSDLLWRDDDPTPATTPARDDHAKDDQARQVTARPSAPGHTRATADERRCYMKPLAGEVIWPALLLTLCSQWLQPPDGAR